MGVQVVDRGVDGGQRLLHAADGAFAARGDHVVAVGGRAVADDFGVDLCAALQRVLQFLDHHHAAAAGDDETVTLGVVGAGGLLGGFVVLGGEGAHGVEQAALAPVFFFTAAGEDHVLLAQLDLLHGLADAMRAGGAGRGDGEVHALDLEGGGQAGGNGAAHGAGHAVWADALDALLTQGVDGFHLVDGRRAAGAGDQAHARIGDLFGAQARVFDGLLHRQVGVGGGIAHEAEEFAIDQLFQVQVDGAGHLAAQTHLRIGGVVADTGLAGAQVGGNGGFVIAQAGDDAQASDHDATHADVLQKLSVEVNRPTRRPSAL
ncbi:hypothetical protein D3C84_444170 [compost metagenome]